MDLIAFYAPLKSPNHVVPSGDRELGAGILAALTRNDLNYEVELISQLRCYDGHGESQVQQDLIAQAEQEIERILQASQSRNLKAWVTYHNYYKAPDLIGPMVCQQLNIPYILIEASISVHRRAGPWAEFARRSDHACAQADIILYLTERDRGALVEHRQQSQRIMLFPPFLNQDSLAAAVAPSVRTTQNLEILAIGMLRVGDKFESYRIIADVLPRLTTPNWHLSVVGDGAASSEIKALFEVFGDRVSFRGQLERQQVTEAYRAAGVFLWPGVNEAFGMVYLEAQAMGLPVVAQDRPGVRDVVAAENTLSPVGDNQSLAQCIDAVLDSDELKQTLGAAGRKFVADKHLLGSAASQLSGHLRSVIPT